MLLWRLGPRLKNPLELELSAMLLCCLPLWEQSMRHPQVRRLDATQGARLALVLVHRIASLGSTRYSRSEVPSASPFTLQLLRRCHFGDQSTALNRSFPVLLLKQTGASVGRTLKDTSPQRQRHFSDLQLYQAHRFFARPR